MRRERALKIVMVILVERHRDTIKTYRLFPDEESTKSTEKRGRRCLRRSTNG